MRSYLYYIGHATTLLSLEGTTFLTDPLLLSRVGPLQRKYPLPPLPDFYQESPVVLLSHGHADHLHLSSLRQLPDDLQIYAPGEIAGYLRKKGFSYSETVSVGDRIELAGGFFLEILPANHNGGRFSEAVGFIIEGKGKRVYFAGDTDLFPEMQNGFGSLDLAVLPISGWGNKLGPGHLDPSRAAEAVEMLMPRHVVPIHWGTLSPIGMPRSWAVDRDADGEFFRSLYRLGLDQKLSLLRPGDFHFLDEPDDSTT